MILNIDLNPSVDRNYGIDVQLGKDNVVRDINYIPGGKGFISSILLERFNEENFITGFLGGINGEFYHKRLADMKIPHECVPIKEETRTLIKLIGGEYTSIKEEGPRITREEVVKLYDLYSRLIERNNIICGLGSDLPQGVPKDIYFHLITMANKIGKKFILDIGEEGLSYGIDGKPYMVVLNKTQLENILKLKLEFESEIVKAGKYILDRGVEFVVIDLESKGSFVLGQDKGYRVEIPSTDRLVKGQYHGLSAGFSLGINRKYDMEMTIRLGQAFNMISSLADDITKIDGSDIKRLMAQIEIYPINY